MPYITSWERIAVTGQAIGIKKNDEKRCQPIIKASSPRTMRLKTPSVFSVSSVAKLDKKLLGIRYGVSVIPFDYREFQVKRTPLILNVQKEGVHL
ncbi:MAG TPA: hypothetical protein VK469_02780 [Candidatus Kapabacteria bacterium]|nr:hypothetical protein [Candidatus Kapabacteria bacterium]